MPALATVPPTPLLLREKRRDLGLNIAEAAEEAGVSRGTWAACEAGVSTPHPKTAKAICDLLGLVPSQVWPVVTSGEGGHR